MTIKTELQGKANRHLWMQAKGWDDMAASGEPMIIDRANGISVTDIEGNTWLDVNGGYSSVNIGYGRKQMADVVKNQMLELSYYPEQTTTFPNALLAEKLAEITPGDLSRVWPVSGGSEANEIAVRMARAYHVRRGDKGRYKIISRYGSYHGATSGVAWLGRPASLGLNQYEPGPLGMIYSSQPNPFSCSWGGKSPSECAVLCAQDIENLIIQNGPDTIAAIIGEPITSSLGAVVPGQEYWPIVREICDRYGILLIDDEVVCGFGRTGRMFGIEHFGVTPDIMTLAKGLGSSYVPIGATIVTTKVADAFAGKENIFYAALTAGGHPVSTASALENINIIEQEDLVEASAVKGRYFIEKLNGLSDKHSVIGDVRGIGLLVAIEHVGEFTIDDEDLGGWLVNTFKNNGLLLRTLSSWVIQMSPPLCVAETEIDFIIDALDATLTKLSSHTSKV